MGAEERFRRRPLQESPRLGVQRRTQEIVAGCVPDVELDGGIEFDQFHQIGLTKVSLLGWRLSLERLCTQFLHWTQRRDMEADLLRKAELQQEEKTTKSNRQ